MCSELATIGCAAADPERRGGGRGGGRVTTKPKTVFASGSQQGKIALVTGSDSGIGSAIAKQLAGAGVDVAVTCHSDESGAKQTAASVREAGRRAIVAALDVSNPDSVAACVEKVNQELGPIDILVNNAGINGNSAPLVSVAYRGVRRLEDLLVSGVDQAEDPFACPRVGLAVVSIKDFQDSFLLPIGLGLVVAEQRVEAFMGRYLGQPSHGQTDLGFGSEEVMQLVKVEFGLGFDRLHQQGLLQQACRLPWVQSPSVACHLQGGHFQLANQP